MVTMFFYEGYICPVCKQKFKENDDIVACPECGAPHHRECWKQEGRCHFAADHGTQRQWRRPEESAYSPPGSQTPLPPANGDTPKYCSRCGQRNPEFAEFCSRCGQNLTSADWSSQSHGAQQNPPYGNNGYADPYAQNNPQNPNAGPSPFGNSPYPGGYGEYSPFHVPALDPFGGVPHDEKVKDATAEELVAYVGPASAYYLPRFFKMAHSGSHVSWNWPAFLFTSYWLLYRKNHLVGGIVLFFSLLQTFISTFIFGTYIEPYLDTSSNAAMYQSLNDLISGGKYSIYFTILSLLFLANLLIKLIFGLTGNSVYMHTSVSRVRKIREKAGIDSSISMDASYRQALISNGGVSLILVAVASGIIWFGQVFLQELFFYIH